MISAMVSFVSVIGQPRSPHISADTYFDARQNSKVGSNAELLPCDKITVQTRNVVYHLHQTVLKAGGIIYVSASSADHLLRLHAGRRQRREKSGTTLRGLW